MKGSTEVPPRFHQGSGSTKVPPEFHQVLWNPRGTLWSLVEPLWSFCGPQNHPGPSHSPRRTSQNLVELLKLSWNLTSNHPDHPTALANLVGPWNLHGTLPCRTCGTLVEPLWNPCGTLVEPYLNHGPPRNVLQGSVVCPGGKQCVVRPPSEKPWSSKLRAQKITCLMGGRNTKQNRNQWFQQTFTVLSLAHLLRQRGRCCRLHRRGPIAPSGPDRPRLRIRVPNGARLSWAPSTVPSWHRLVLLNTGKPALSYNMLGLRRGTIAPRSGPDCTVGPRSGPNCTVGPRSGSDCTVGPRSGRRAPTRARLRALFL